MSDDRSTKPTAILIRVWRIICYPFKWRERRRKRVWRAMSRAYGTWPDGEGM